MSDRDDVPYIVVERRSGGMGLFLWGALIGAGVALLYAPRSGAQTRQEIRDGAYRVRRRAEESVRRVQETVSGTVGDLREQVTSKMDAARDALDAGREAARETRQDIERRVRESRSAWRPAASPIVAPSSATPPPTGGVIEQVEVVTRIDIDPTEQAGM